MEVYEVLLPLSVILAMTTVFGVLSKKIGLPSVIGMLLTGILISLLRYIPGVSEGTFLYDAFFSEEMKGHYELLAKIGVVLIMFSAGLGTDIAKIKETGKTALVVTVLGVVCPMGLGFLVAFLFDYYTPICLVDGTMGAVGEVHILSDLFYGAILTATSVSIT
ncbi:MAG: cation:proton antiporter, partial [Christensenellaceae bacterium]